MKIVKKFVLIIFVSLVFLPAALAEVDKVVYDLVGQALNNNPTIKSLEKEWEAMRAKILSEKTLPQPEFTFVHFGESVQTRVGPQKRKFGIKQPIPFPTKLSTKGKIAQKEAEIAYSRYILGIRAIVDELKAYIYDYYFA